MTDTAAPCLYLIADEAVIAPEAAAERLPEALATGSVACVRIDMTPTALEADWRRVVNLLLPPCHEADVPLVVTDRDDLVLPLGLDGVHLASSTASVAGLRKTLGTDRIVGAHGGAERHRGMTLAEAGADYIALGPVAAASEDLYRWWSKMIATPLVAEGGVDLEAAQRIAPYVDFLAPDPALLWPDPADALPRFAALLSEPDDDS
ncbi:MAG: thiamine phosphate synthase [Pseudomonadota bacterium]